MARKVRVEYPGAIYHLTVVEDVSFRRMRQALSADTILAVVAASAGVDVKDLGHEGSGIKIENKRT